MTAHGASGYASGMARSVLGFRYPKVKNERLAKALTRALLERGPVPVPYGEYELATKYGPLRVRSITPSSSGRGVWFHTAFENPDLAKEGGLFYLNEYSGKWNHLFEYVDDVPGSIAAFNRLLDSVEARDPRGRSSGRSGGRGSVRPGLFVTFRNHQGLIQRGVVERRADAKVHGPNAWHVQSHGVRWVLNKDDMLTTSTVAGRSGGQSDVDARNRATSDREIAEWLANPPEKALVYYSDDMRSVHNWMGVKMGDIVRVGKVTRRFGGKVQAVGVRGTNGVGYHGICNLTGGTYCKLRRVKSR